MSKYQPLDGTFKRRRSALPDGAEMATWLRNGETTINDIAEAFDRSPSTVLARLNKAGYSHDGQPMRRTAKSAPPAARRPQLWPGMWVENALCAQTDPEAFFPEKGGRHAARDAIAMCNGCDAQQPCLEYALSLPQGEDHGVLGGTTERERRRLRKQARGAA